MRFNLIYNTYSENDSSFNSFIDEDFSYHTKNNESKLSDLCFYLEQHPVFHFKDNNQHFINPETLEQKENTIDIFFDSNTKSKDLAFYNSLDGSIYISTGLLTQRDILGDFQSDLRTTLSENELINYAFLHELGHAVQHQYILENSKVFQNNESFSLNEKIINSLADKYKNLEFKIEDRLTEKLTQSVFEGYADLYACTVLKENLPEERFNLVLDQIIQSRENDDLKSNYNTANSLKQFKEDINNGNYNINNFSNFNDVNNYIEKTIMNTAVHSLEKEIINNEFKNSFDSKKCLHVLGEIKEGSISGNIPLNLNQNSSAKDVIHSIGGNSNSFENGLNTYIKNQTFIRQSKIKDSTLSKEELSNKIQQDIKSEINQSFGSSYSNNSNSNNQKHSIKRNLLSL